MFVAFDRLEEILQPPAAPPQPPRDESTSLGTPTLLGDGAEHPQINKDRDNVTRVINSKVVFRFSCVVYSWFYLRWLCIWLMLCDFVFIDVMWGDFVFYVLLSCGDFVFIDLMLGDFVYDWCYVRRWLIHYVKWQCLEDTHRAGKLGSTIIFTNTLYYSFRLSRPVWEKDVTYSCPSPSGWPCVIYALKMSPILLASFGTTPSSKYWLLLFIWKQLF